MSSSCGEIYDLIDEEIEKKRKAIKFHRERNDSEEGIIRDYMVEINALQILKDKVAGSICR